MTVRAAANTIKPWKKQTKCWHKKTTDFLCFVIVDVCGGSTEIWVSCFSLYFFSYFFYSGTAKKVAEVQHNTVRVDNCNTSHVELWPRGQALRFGGITCEEMLLWGQWKESSAGPVKHAAGVSYRLDIHDHCQPCQSIYRHFQRGLESESLCSVFWRRISQGNYFSFIFCYTLQCCSGDV